MRHHIVIMLPHNDAKSSGNAELPAVRRMGSKCQSGTSPHSASPLIRKEFFLYIYIFFAPRPRACAVRVVGGINAALLRYAGILWPAANAAQRGLSRTLAEQSTRAQPREHSRESTLHTHISTFASNSRLTSNITYAS